MHVVHGANTDMPSSSFLGCSDRYDAIHPLYCCSRNRLGICHTVLPFYVSAAGTRHVGASLPFSIHPVKGGRVRSGVSALPGPSRLGFACWCDDILSIFFGVICRHVSAWEGFKRGVQKGRRGKQKGRSGARTT